MRGSRHHRYKPEEGKAFYDWMLRQTMATREEWEAKWLEITGVDASYEAITQRLYKWGYRWRRIGKTHFYSGGWSRFPVGAIVKRKNSHDKTKASVNWIKVKRFEDLTPEERAAHVAANRKAIYGASPCWMRHDEYVLRQNGIELGKGEHVVHLNGDTLDDSPENLFVTDRYQEYCGLKIKGLCAAPEVVEAYLETKKAERALERIGR